MRDMRELFDNNYAPDRYYRLAAEDIRKSITREVANARSESERGLRPAGDPWAALDLIDVAGIPDVGILSLLPPSADCKPRERVRGRRLVPG